MTEDNSFGTHEFMELCDQLGCEPYIAVNLGSGTVQEAAEWIEYMTADGDSTIVKQRQANGRKEPWHLKYVGIGNENWGCGGSMSPDFYANEYNISASARITGTISCIRLPVDRVPRTITGRRSL